MSEPLRERAFAKANLILQVGPPRPDGLHPLCSLFASLELADEVTVRPAPGGSDTVHCPGVEGPNLAVDAIAAMRSRVPALPALDVEIHKRIPVAAGLGGGSADAAAVLRAANRIAGAPLDAGALRAVASGLGSDVPSQVEPAHGLVAGVGEQVEPIGLPSLGVVLVPRREGLSTAAVYERLDRMRGWRERLDRQPLRDAAAALRRGDLAGATLHNDLQSATLDLRPELAEILEGLERAGAGAALVCGSGPTVLGLFADRDAAQGAAAQVSEALVTRLRGA